MKMKKIKVSEHHDMAMPSMAHYPPSFSVDSTQMPEIKDWEVGAKYKLMIEVEQKTKEETEQSTSSRFDIVAYHYKPEKTMEEMSDDEFREYSNHVRSRGSL